MRSLLLIAFTVAWCATASGETADFRFGYLSETATNIQGGDRQLWRYADQWTFAATIDLQELLGIEQAVFAVTLTDRNGRSLSRDAGLGSLQQVQEIYGRGQTWRWTQFSYQQQYFDGRLDWKIGRLVGGEDFADFSCEFMNLTFCGPPPGNIAVGYWYNWPVSQWATRLRANFKGLGYVQLGAYEVDPDNLLTKNGMDLGDSGGASGVLVPLEAAWQPVFRSTLDGSYKVGAWYNTSSSAGVAEHYGAYINFLQRLTAPTSERGVRVFLNATFADRRSALTHQIATGVFYTGPFDLRANDEVGFAIGSTHARTLGSECVSEIFYALRAASWLELRPNVQYVHQPGGLARKRGHVIAGVRVSFNL